MGHCSRNQGWGCGELVQRMVVLCRSLYDLAVTLQAAGDRVSACNAFLRASNYYRTAYIFMFAVPVDSRVIEAYQEQTDSFQKAAVLFEQPIQVLNIPYQNTTLPGY